MKKRIVAGMLFTTILCMAFGGCGNTADQKSTNSDGAVESVVPGAEASTEIAFGDTEADNGVVQLKVWSEEDNFDMLNQMIDSFKQKYAGEAKLEITLEQNADSDTKDVLLGDIHNGADVFSFADDQLSAMVAAGALYPVPNADEVKNANLEEAVSAASINDTLYAYPMTADNGYFLYYDKNVLSDTDVQTMDGILAALDAAGKSFSMGLNSGWYLYSFFGNTGLEFGINDDGVTNYCNWNSTDGAIKGIDVAQSILNITTNPAFISQPDGDFVTGVQNGTIGAGISGVWNAVSIKEAWGDDYGAVKLPTYTVAGQQIQMSSFTGYKMMGVNTYSKYPEWAAKLADWLTNEENQTIRFEERNQGPSNTNAAASDAVKQVPAIQAVIAQSEFGKLQRVGNSYWDACSAFGDTMAAGNPSGQDLQEIMDILVDGITASTAK
jgi:arabinogalactan oligomer/maltooligosaccharide transport system substrate-binding protein